MLRFVAAFSYAIAGLFSMAAGILRDSIKAVTKLPHCKLLRQTDALDEIGKARIGAQAVERRVNFEELQRRRVFGVSCFE